MEYPTSLSLQDYRDDVQKALRSWHKGDYAASPFDNLLIYQQTLPSAPSASPHRATNFILLQALERMKCDQPQMADILCRHYLDGELVQEIARRLGVEEKTIYKRQRQAIDALSDILGAMESAARAKRQKVWEWRLMPPTYLQLVAVEAQLTQLANQLNRPHAPWLFAIVGLGGTGKSALADALVRRVMERECWADFAWITADEPEMNSESGSIGHRFRPSLPRMVTAEALIDKLWQQLALHHEFVADLPPTEKITLLQCRLKAQPHLVVFDNLEHLQNPTELLKILRRLMNPSKFLLITRMSFYRELDIHHFVMPELNKGDALRVLRNEACACNVTALLSASDSDLAPIYTTVGGNPRALRLIIGQAHIHTLSDILADLQTGCGQYVENLYCDVYEMVWEQLGEPAKRVLALLLQANAEGCALNTLIAAACANGMTVPDVRNAVDQLVACNLVASQGDLQSRRYTLHNLTRTFLQQV